MMTCSLIIPNNTLFSRTLALLLFISASVFSYAQETTFTGIEFTGVFGGTTYDGINYTSPTGSEPWAGFANEDVSIYPLSFVDGGSIAFTGATSGTDAVIYFRFEYNPYPDTEPSFNTIYVTVSGVDGSPYSVDIPSQGTNTYSSFLLYVTTLDAPVSLTDVSVTATFSSTDVYGCTDPAADNYDSSATIDDGSCSYASTALTITTTVCSSAASVRMTGPWWGWDPNAGPAAVDNGDDTWTFTLDPAPTADMEYLLVVDGVQENLIQSMIDGGSCAPITDYANYANRLWVLGSGNVTNVYGTCGSCATADIPGCTDPAADNYDSNATTDDGSCTYTSTVLTITTTVCNSASSVQMTGPWWGWDPNAGPAAVDNGDDTWTFTFDPAPTADMEYLLVVDGVQEDLVAEGTASEDWSCTPITDYWSYANRQWAVGSGNVINVYGTCGECVSGDIPGCTDATANNYDTSATSDDGSCTYDVTLTVDMNCSGLTPGAVAATGPSDGWSCGTYALSDGDGDGVWEGTFSLAAGSFEYIYCTDGWAQQETAGLVAEMQNGGTCAPVTDYASYANRLITIGAITTTDTWGSCSVCDPSVISGCTDPAADNYNADATSDDGSCTYPPIILTITTTVCNSASTVQMTGPWWGWDPNAGPAAVDNGDNTWTFTLNPAPTDNMEYLLVVDGVQEDLVAAGTTSEDWSCTPVTDYWSYANRQWAVGSGDVTNVYGTCGECVVLGCMYTNADNYNPLSNDDDGSCIFPNTSTCLGDLDGDNVAGTSDLLALLASFGSVCP